MNKKRELYLKLCDEAKEILSKTGIMDICIRCSTVKSYRDFSDLGCCTGCLHLSKEGCTTYSLACRLWFCKKELRDIIMGSAFKDRWMEIESSLYEKEKSICLFGCDANIPRKGIEDFIALQE